MTQDRIEELILANKLEYPRLRAAAHRMRFPVFTKDFDGLVAGQPPTEKEVTLHGRVMSVRKAGAKLAFVDLRQDSVTVQIMINESRLKWPESGMRQSIDDFVRHLIRGDMLEVTGRPIRMPQGTLTLSATVLPTVVAPTLAPPPHELVDEETRIQNRHVELLIDSTAANILQIRSEIMRGLREFFYKRHFTEVSTPILAANAGGAVARPFVTHATELGAERELALRIAPELWLKRLVVGGMDKVFEIGPAFRNEGIDATHNPEFTVCEFYQSYIELEQLIEMTLVLLRELILRIDEHFQKRNISVPKPSELIKDGYERLEFIPTLEERLGFKFPDLEDEDAALPRLLELLQSRNISLSPSVSGDNTSAAEAAAMPPPKSLPKLLDRLAGMYLENTTSHSFMPLFITHHPACMSPLSKLFRCPKTGQLVSARAELFVNGMEIANMYEEENDPFEQRRRMVEQVRAARRRTGKKESELASAETEGDIASDSKAQGVDEDGMPVVDEQYLQVLRTGLPPTGGWGCGVERLVMLLSRAERISGCLPFGTLRNVVGLAAGGKRKSD
jgi:lysyl-tRNA synthetase, class II